MDFNKRDILNALGLETESNFWTVALSGCASCAGTGWGGWCAQGKLTSPPATTRRKASAATKTVKR